MDKFIDSLYARIQMAETPDAIVEALYAALDKAWNEGHEHCFHVEDPGNPERSPYRDK